MVSKRAGHPWDIILIDVALNEVIDNVKRPLQTTQDTLLMNSPAIGLATPMTLFASTALYLIPTRRIDGHALQRRETRLQTRCTLRVAP